MWESKKQTHISFMTNLVVCIKIALTVQFQDVSGMIGIKSVQVIIRMIHLPNKIFKSMNYSSTNVLMKEIFVRIHLILNQLHFTGFLILLGYQQTITAFMIFKKMEANFPPVKSKSKFT